VDEGGYYGADGGGGGSFVTADATNVIKTSGVNTGYGFISIAAPEPGAWVMMILGLAGVGAALRRRRLVLSS
jgi:hypothetical protein